MAKHTPRTFGLLICLGLKSGVANLPDCTSFTPKSFCNYKPQNIGDKHCYHTKGREYSKRVHFLADIGSPGVSPPRCGVILRSRATMLGSASPSRASGLCSSSPASAQLRDRVLAGELCLNHTGHMSHSVVSPPLNSRTDFKRSGSSSCRRSCR